MVTCSCESCDLPVRALGLCSKHYVQSRLKSRKLRNYEPIESRFWAKVDRRAEDECWPWVGTKSNHGYGIIYKNGVPKLAHRVGYEIEKGSIPESDGSWHGYVIMHTCDNRLCVNPKHLLLGTQSDNVKDMDAKGRRVLNPMRGEKHHASIFTDAQRAAIVEDVRGHSEVAREYNTSPQVVFYVRKAAGKNPKDYAHGKDKSHPGAHNPNAKLSEDDIRAMRSSGKLPTELAREYNMSVASTSKILLRKSWRHVI